MRALADETAAAFCCHRLQVTAVAEEYPKREMYHAPGEEWFLRAMRTACHMRIDSLDGLRGVAILAVLLYHHDLFDNGWMGVDIFFVLSGFLITGILRKESKDKFYWKRFYIQRATRILPPALLIVLLACLLAPGAKPLVCLGYLLTLGGVIDLQKNYLNLPLTQCGRSPSKSISMLHGLSR